MRFRSSSFLAAALLAATTSIAHADVSVDHPWVRGVVAGQSSTGAFMTIRSTQATELVRVSSPIAAGVSLHRMVMTNSMMSMEPMEALPIPANGLVELKPGTYHLMLIGLKRSLKPGASVPLRLTFRGADRIETSLTVQATVSDPAGAAPGATM